MVSSSVKWKRFILSSYFGVMADVSHDLERVLGIKIINHILQCVRLLLEGLPGKFEHFIHIISQMCA